MIVSILDTLKTSVKSKIALLGIVISFLPPLIGCLPVLIFAFIYDRYKPPVQRDEGTCFGLLYAADEFASAMLGFYHQTTISSMIGQLSYKSVTANMVRKVVDTIWYWFTKELDHCRSAIQKEDKFYFNVRKSLIMMTINASFIYVVITKLI